MAAILGVEIIEKLIAAGIERTDKNRNLAAGRDHFLAMEVVAFKFRHGGILITDDQLDLLAGGDRNLARDKFAALDHDDDIAIVGMGRKDDSQRQNGPAKA